jgi:chromate reductase
VLQFKAKIKAADALLIVTPEYNYSIPGILKNAIDWASRPPVDNVFQGKPAAIMSASTGMLGGARAQYHLRQTFVMLDVHPINKPEVMISLAEQKFDTTGRLTDEKAKELIRLLFKNLVEWTLKLKSSNQTATI